LSRDFFVIENHDFRGNTWKVWGKIKQNMTEKDLSGAAAEVIEQACYQ